MVIIYPAAGGGGGGGLLILGSVMKWKQVTGKVYIIKSSLLGGS